MDIYIPYATLDHFLCASLYCTVLSARPRCPTNHCVWASSVQSSDGACAQCKQNPEPPQNAKTLFCSGSGLSSPSARQPGHSTAIQLIQTEHVDSRWQGRGPGLESSPRGDQCVCIVKNVDVFASNAVWHCVVGYHNLFFYSSAPSTIPSLCSVWLRISPPLPFERVCLCIFI